MATHQGKEGVVKIGSNSVAEVTEFEFTERANTVDDSELSDDWETHLVGRKSWDGSLTCRWDETDTTGQGACTVGASVSLALYPEGDASSDTYYSGTATITEIKKGNSPDAAVDVTFSFKGSGALASATVV